MYVCTCCHQMLFVKNINVFNENAHGFTHEEALYAGYWYKAEGANEFICRRCQCDLRFDPQMPAQAVTKKLALETIPLQLENLTVLKV